MIKSIQGNNFIINPPVGGPIINDKISINIYPVESLYYSTGVNGISKNFKQFNNLTIFLIY